MEVEPPAAAAVAAAVAEATAEAERATLTGFAAQGDGEAGEAATVPGPVLNVLERIARTGTLRHGWDLLRLPLCVRLQQVLSEYREKHSAGDGEPPLGSFLRVPSIPQEATQKTEDEEESPTTTTTATGSTTDTDTDTDTGKPGKPGSPNGVGSDARPGNSVADGAEAAAAEAAAEPEPMQVEEEADGKAEGKAVDNEAAAASSTDTATAPVAGGGGDGPGPPKVETVASDEATTRRDSTATQPTQTATPTLNPLDSTATRQNSEEALVAEHEQLYQRLRDQPGIPFTCQRLCEVLCTPDRSYKSVGKLTRALQRLVMVTSTVEPTEPVFGLPGLPQQPPPRLVEREATTPEASEEDGKHDPPPLQRQEWMLLEKEVALEEHMPAEDERPSTATATATAATTTLSSATAAKRKFEGDSNTGSAGCEPAPNKSPRLDAVAE